MSLTGYFTAQEWNVLGGGLRLKDFAERDPLRSLMARDVLQEEVCEQLLDALGPVIGSPTRAITASLLGKRLSFLATGACLYAMSVYDKGLLLSLDNTVIEYGHDDGLWTSSLPLHHGQPLTYGTNEREAWREAVVQALFAGLLKPLWQTFNRVTGVSRRILWENTAVRVYSLYEKRMAKIDDPSVRERCEADFQWLLTQAEPALFGLEYNPLSHFRRPPTLVDDGQRSIRFRRTCCFYYLATEPAEYCSTCPLLRPGKKMPMSDQITLRQQVVSQELLAAYRTIPSSTLGHFSDRGFLRGIKPLFNDIRMVGQVVTVKVFPPDGSILREALLLSEPGDVLVIECVGDKECGCWGELRTLAGLIKGLAGVVVSGAVTDVSALRRHGLPVFCRDVSAFTTRGIGAQGEVNQPIQVGEVRVQPGDLAIGDDDGVFILDPGQAAELLPELLIKEEADQRRRAEFLQRLNARPA